MSTVASIVHKWTKFEHQELPAWIMGYCIESFEVKNESNPFWNKVVT